MDRFAKVVTLTVIITSSTAANAWWNVATPTGEEGVVPAAMVPPHPYVAPFYGAALAPMSDEQRQALVEQQKQFQEQAAKAWQEAAERSIAHQRELQRPLVEFQKQIAEDFQRHEQERLAFQEETQKYHEEKMQDWLADRTQPYPRALSMTPEARFEEIEALRQEVQARRDELRKTIDEQRRMIEEEHAALQRRSISR
jgi:hypothetical protein